MKLMGTILMLMILLTSHPTTAQTTDDYLLKSRHQKTAAWILAGGGTGLVFTGYLIGLHGVVDLVNNGHTGNIGAGASLIIIGGAAMLGSIPLFIASSNNRRRGASLSFSTQTFPALIKNMVCYKYVPSVSLHLKL